MTTINDLPAVSVVADQDLIPIFQKRNRRTRNVSVKELSDHIYQDVKSDIDALEVDTAGLRQDVDALQFDVSGLQQFDADLGDNTDPAKGAGMVGYAEATVGEFLGRIQDANSRRRNFFWYLSGVDPEALSRLISDDETLDIGDHVRAFINSGSSSETLCFPVATYRFQKPKDKVYIDSPKNIVFEWGARLLFVSPDAEYVQPASSDIYIENIWVDGGPAAKVRGVPAGIRVQNQGTPTENIVLIRPRVCRVSSAGVLVGGAHKISKVYIENPVVWDTGADGVGLHYWVEDAVVVSPRAYRTGDDGVSIVNYTSSGGISKNLTVLDALSVDSVERGLTIIGGSQITFTGKSVGSAKQGVLLIRDNGAYVANEVRDVYVNVESRDSVGDGVSVGRDVIGLTGELRSYNAGARGVVIAGAIGEAPREFDISSIVSVGASAVGVYLDNVLDGAIGTITSRRSGADGVLAFRLSGVVIGDIKVYDPNETAIANRFGLRLSVATNSSVRYVYCRHKAGGALTSAFQIDSCQDIAVGPYQLTRNGSAQLDPTTPGSSAVRFDSQFSVGTTPPAVGDLQINEIYRDSAGLKMYVRNSGVLRSWSIT